MRTAYVWLIASVASPMVIGMIDLHERLSEFSYGYGVTREAEALLAAVGVSTTPFLPSLLQEKEVAFDAGFKRRGAPLLLQFKLGQSLRRFVRSDMSAPAPNLVRPFWRYNLNTAEPDGQFETLLKAELDGAEVYYVAPRFTDWPRYLRFYETGAVLENSLLMTPKAIRHALDAESAPDGPHRIVYDRSTAHVCSKPTELPEVRSEELGPRIRANILERGDELGRVVRQVFEGLDDRSMVRRDTVPQQVDGAFPEEGARLDERTAPRLARSQRNQRLEGLRNRSRSEDDAFAAALGIEVWSLGIQLVFATIKD